MNISRVLNSVYCDDSTVRNCPIPPLACCGIGIRFKYHRCQFKKKTLYFLSHSGTRANATRDSCKCYSCQHRSRLPWGNGVDCRTRKLLIGRRPVRNWTRRTISSLLLCRKLHLFLGKSTKNASTRAALFDSNMHQIICRLWLCPTSTGGYSANPGP